MPSNRVPSELLGDVPESACIHPSQVPSGGRREEAPAVPRPETPALFARLREHVWAPVVLKATAIVLGTFLLAGVGIASSWANANGMPVALGAATAASSAGSRPLQPSDQGRRAAVPRAQESKTDAGDGGVPTERGAEGPVEKIVLNRASADELTRLPSVGRKRAQAIVELRDRLHGFKRLTDLLRIRGIGPRSLKRMLPHLVLDAPAGEAGTTRPER